jgi:hypothetical protein
MKGRSGNSYRSRKSLLSEVGGERPCITSTVMAAIPITVFTGFLGAGKTSIIISILARLPQNYNIVLLKNEFGDVQVDSKLAQQSSLTAVSEILNGCM